MPLVRAYSRNLGQRLILARKGTFWKKGTKILPLSGRGVKHNIGLEYALLVASNSHISRLSHPLWKNVNDSKNYVVAVPTIM